MAAMQFWGVEIKGNKPCSVKVEEGSLIHVSQATLSEVKKGSEPVTLYVKVGDQKLVMGILNLENSPQLSFDLVFEQNFEVSHNSKNGSVHLLGYHTEMPDEYSDEELPESSDEEEELPLPAMENGKAPALAPATGALKAAAKPIKDNKPKSEEKPENDDDDDSDEDDEDDSDEDDADADMADMSDDSDEDDSDEDDDDEDDSEKEEEPAKPANASGKKRPKPDAKTPDAKKQKLATPQKTDGKKGSHTATPHPSKKSGKTPGGDKSTPKSGSQVSCGSCKKTFNSDKALESHNKAKHGGK